MLVDGMAPVTQIEVVAERVRERFGVPTLGNKKNPLDELIYIVLSSRTPPASYQAAYQTIRRAFASWELLADATIEEITEAIAVGGLQRKKAAQLHGMTNRLREVFGRVTLAPLRQMGDEDAERFLLSLPGVGIKTARCVLMYSLDREVFPVDVHCLRVTRRLGWVRAHGSLNRALADEIQGAIPRGARKQLHVGMIMLGRSVCLPAKPACWRCPILQFCETGGGAAVNWKRARTQMFRHELGDEPSTRRPLKRAAETRPEYRFEG